MTDDHDIDDLLRAVDDDGPVPDSFIEDLFAELDEVIRGERPARRGPNAVDEPTAAHGTAEPRSESGTDTDDALVIDFESQPAGHNARPWRWVVAAAAAVAVLAASVALLGRQDETVTNPPATTPSTTVAPPPSADPELATEADPSVACRRFAGSVGSLDDLARAVGQADTAAARAALRPQIDAAITASEQFEIDLAAAEFERAASLIGLATGGLQQATAEIDQADVGRAAESVRFAAEHIGTMSPEIFEVAGPCLVDVTATAMRN